MSQRVPGFCPSVRLSTRICDPTWLSRPQTSGDLAAPNKNKMGIYVYNTKRYGDPDSPGGPLTPLTPFRFKFRTRETPTAREESAILPGSDSTLELFPSILPWTQPWSCSHRSCLVPIRVAHSQRVRGFERAPLPLHGQALHDVADRAPAAGARQPRLTEPSGARATLRSRRLESQETAELSGVCGPTQLCAILQL
jgi:hypothetical protein